jgi:methylenetetrahydrofolate dehydrogenase (NADP+)/methenyltetrahydrofolate cyclohydrolase
MAELLKGKPVADAINERTRKDVEFLKNRGVTPVLAILRVGEKESDLSYERGAVKRCTDVGVEVKKVVLPEDVSYEQFYETLDDLNHDKAVHGILMFRPLPKYLDNEKARLSISPLKDVDGCTDGSLTGIFTNRDIGFAPCTAQAAIEILDHYGIDPKGKNIVVVGRSLVVGKPVAMMLLNRHATVTICHTRTVDLPAVTRKADIIIAAAGQIEMLTKEYFSEGQIIIDVGIDWNEKKNKLCGDVLAEDADLIVRAYTPVPGGVGAVTTSVLVSHVAVAAKKML